MRILIWIITIFALAVGLAMLVSQDWGYVQFVIPSLELRVQTSNRFLLLALIVVFLVVYFLVRLIQNTLVLPEAVGRWRERRRRQRADRSLSEAILAFHEARYAQALKLAKKAFDASDKPVPAILLAARSAHALRDEDSYRQWMVLLADNEESSTARLVTEAELAIDSNSFEEAAEKLSSLPEDVSNNTAVQRLSLRVSVALQYWEEVIRLTLRLRKQKALTGEESRTLLRLAYLERLRGADSDSLVSIWEGIASSEREDRQLLEQAVPLFAGAGQGSVLRRAVERLLDNQWDSALARLYGYCGDIAACLAKGEKWLNDHSRDGGLLYALGCLCAESKLWGKAEGYFAASLEAQPEIETHLALARLFESLDRNDAAQRHFRAAAEMAGDASYP